MMKTVVAVTPAVTLLLWRWCLVAVAVFVVVVSAQTDDDPSNNSTAKIIGGTPAAAGDFPAFVHPVRSDCKGFCGGILVHADMFLTAAHCQGSWLQAGRVAIGGRTLSQCGNDATDVIDVVAEFNHPNYVDAANAPPLNDVALVKLARATTVTPARWNTDTSVPPVTGTQSPVVACGFGQIATSGQTSTDKLLKVATTSATQATCSGLYATDSAKVLCAGEAGKGVCFGDSGGPLFLSGTTTVVGISSFVSAGCAANPAGFARVATYSAWIQQTICDRSSVKPASCGDSFPFNIPLLGPLLKFLWDALLSLFT